MLVIGPKVHKTCGDGQRCFTPCAINNTANTTGCLDFSARNAYATVTAAGGIVLSYTDTSACGTAKGCAVNYQTLLEKHSGYKTVNPVKRVDFGAAEGVLAGPGAGIVLGRHSISSAHPGRWVGCGGVGYVGGGPISMSVWYSDTQGDTYALATGGGLPFLGIGECQAVELKNGSVMVNARNGNCRCVSLHPGGARPVQPQHAHASTRPGCSRACCSALPGCTQHHRLYSISNDGGATFSAPKFAADLPEPICSAGLINHGGDLYFSNPDESGPSPRVRTGRTHMTVKKSVDSGEHWAVDTPVWAGPAAYSVVAPLDEKSVGVVYERGRAWTTNPYEKITMAIVQI